MIAPEFSKDDDGNLCGPEGQAILFSAGKLSKKDVALIFRCLHRVRRESQASGVDCETTGECLFSICLEWLKLRSKPAE